MTQRTERKVIQMVKSNPRVTSCEISTSLKEAMDLKVHPSTIRKRLIANDLRAYRPRKKAKITPAQVVKRLKWAKKVQDTK